MLVSLYPDQIKQAPKSSGIYVITHEPTGKVYVGIAVDIRKRWGSHLASLRRGDHTNTNLQSAWCEGCESDFQFNILELIDDSDKLRSRENFWISLFGAHLSNTGFNVVSRTRTPQCNPIKERGRATSESLSELRSTLENETKYLGTSTLARRFGCSVATVTRTRRKIAKTKVVPDIPPLGKVLSDWVEGKIETKPVVMSDNPATPSLPF